MLVEIGKYRNSSALLLAHFRKAIGSIAKKLSNMCLYLIFIYIFVKYDVYI